MKSKIIKSLSQKIQKNGSRIPNQSKFIIDFAGVLSIDSGAAFGLVEGLFFVAETNPNLHIEIRNIKVRPYSFCFKLFTVFQDPYLEMLHQCGLHESVKVSSKSPEEVTSNVVAKNEKVKQRCSQNSQIISDL